jgi:hypothetical protein
MKQRIRFSFLIALTASIFIFSSCKKDTGVNTNTDTSGLMAFNLIPDSSSSVGFLISGNLLTNSPLAFSNYTGNYLPVYSGTRDVQLINAADDSVQATTSYAFVPTRYYSLFALGANGHYSNLIVNDNLDSLSATSDNAFVRYINAIPDSTKPTVTFSSNGTNVVEEQAPYASISDFKEVTPGDIDLKVNNESTFSAERTITVEKNKVYTVLLMGLPGQTDTTRAVQIKYIQNGTVTP